MKISEKIAQKINDLPEGASFGYEELDISSQEYLTAAKALERLQKKGVIKKVAKGKFYKPEQTIFGELKPSEEELLKPYLFDNGKRIAYITGSFLYNQLGLTNQVSSRIKIASLNKRIYIQMGAIKATPVKSYAEVTDGNFQLLGVLDAIKDLKVIPDVDLNVSISFFTNFIKQLSKIKRSELVKLAIKYPPRVRALLGALLEQLGFWDDITKLKTTLNPLTEYELRISESLLQTAPNWNIK
jgi:hypothetical protein